MHWHKHKFVRALLLALLLVTGPLHAQIVTACAMMETAAHCECACCDHSEHKPCPEPGCDTAIDSGGEPCCQQSVELGFDDDGDQRTPGAKPAEMRTDADRPQIVVASLELVAAPHVVALRGDVQSLPPPGRDGSDIYLITQRLRI